MAANNVFPDAPHIGSNSCNNIGWSSNVNPYSTSIMIPKDETAFAPPPQSNAYRTQQEVLQSGSGASVISSQQLSNSYWTSPSSNTTSMHSSDSSIGSGWGSASSENSPFSYASLEWGMKVEPQPETHVLEHDKPASPDRPPKRRRRNVAAVDKHAEKLEKDRRAAEKCRQKQRAWQEDLQERTLAEEKKRANLIQQVTELQESILCLKECMVSHSGCNDERLRQYLLQDLAKTTKERQASVASSTSPHKASRTIPQAPNGTKRYDS